MAEREDQRSPGLGTERGGEIAQSKFEFVEPSTPMPNTQPWAVLQTHDPSIEGDLVWRPAGDPVRLEAPKIDGFEVTWKGNLEVPSIEQRGTHRLLLTETETHLRADWGKAIRTRPTSPTDFVRSRIVYADAFALGPVPAPDGYRRARERAAPSFSGAV